MDEGAEINIGLETGEKETHVMKVKDERGQVADEIQARAFEERIQNNVEKKLLQFEALMGEYAKQKVSEGLTVYLADGAVGNGEVVDGKLSVNLPNGNEIRTVRDNELAKPYIAILDGVGITYEEYAMAAAESTALHESVHMIIDSRPGSKLEKDFKDATDIENDEGGYTLSLLDEGITYAFQLEVDSESEVMKKLEKEKPQTKDNFIVETRKILGEKLREKVRTYVGNGWAINGAFLEDAGKMMKEIDMKRYIAESRLEKVSHSR